MSRAAGSPATPDQVRAMFDAIARRYDLMNTVMTAGLDASWRRATIDAAGLEGGTRVLDVATGTGRLALAAADAMERGGTVIGLDASPGMLAVARSRSVARRGRNDVTWVHGDALALPFAAASFDAVLIGFGLRNLPDYAAGIGEMARVAAPGGRVVVLEIARPRAAVPRLVHATWFRHAVPLLGRVAGMAEAYAYLPASLDPYPDPEGVGALMSAAGLRDVRWRWLAGGLTTLHVGIRR